MNLEAVTHYSYHQILQMQFADALKQSLGDHESEEWREILGSFSKPNKKTPNVKTIESLTYVFSNLGEIDCPQKIFPTSFLKLIESFKPTSLMPSEDKQKYQSILNNLYTQIRVANVFDKDMDKKYLEDLASSLKQFIQELWYHIDIIKLNVMVNFKEKLKTGEIRAEGYQLPLKHNFVRQPILPELWRLLEFDEKGEAESEGLKYKDIIFRIGSEHDLLPKKLGRSTKMDRIKEKMKQRAEEGNLDLTGLKAECVYLQNWCQTDLEQFYKVESLQKKLGELYRELKAKYSKL